jgi:hypothetical protein
MHSIECVFTAQNVIDVCKKSPKKCIQITDKKQTARVTYWTVKMPHPKLDNKLIPLCLALTNVKVFYAQSKDSFNSGDTKKSDKQEFTPSFSIVLDNKAEITDALLAMNDVFIESHTLMSGKRPTTLLRPLVSTDYSDKVTDITKQGKPREAPIMKLKISLNKNKNIPNTLFLDFTKPIIENGKLKSYEPLLINGEEVNEDNFHEVLKKGINVNYILINMFSISQTTFYSWYPTVNKIVVDPRASRIDDSDIMSELLAETTISSINSTVTSTVVTTPPEVIVQPKMNEKPQQISQAAAITLFDDIMM